MADVRSLRGPVTVWLGVVAKLGGRLFAGTIWIDPARDNGGAADFFSARGFGASPCSPMSLLSSAMRGIGLLDARLQRLHAFVDGAALRGDHHQIRRGEL